MAAMDRPRAPEQTTQPRRTALELLEHLLAVGEWYGSAIELDIYADGGHVDGEDLAREAREIVRRERGERDEQRG